MKSFGKKLAKKRPLIHAINSVGVIASVVIFHISLPIIMIAGLIAGLFGGKLFCRWFCPIGLMMEKMMPSNPDEKSIHLYQYYKLGCPIAWGSGLANRFSIFRIGRKRPACTDCGACDRACYIVKVNPITSLYKKGFKDAAQQYSCSRCLACVSACPTGALSVAVAPAKTTDKVDSPQP